MEFGLLWQICLKLFGLGSKANMGLKSSNEQIKNKAHILEKGDLFGRGIETNMGLTSSNEHVKPELKPIQNNLKY